MVDSTPLPTGEEEEEQHSPSSTLASKWLGLVSALWVQAISGNNYTFANYSVELKAILGVNQVQLNGLSSAKDVGKAFGVVAGLLCDYLPPWTILLIGSLEGMLGYGTQWLVISHKIQPLPYWIMCVVMCMGGNSTTWMNTAVLVTCVRNFRRSRGPVSGILKAYVGLSTAIFTDLCTALFTGDASAFVLMLALIPLGVCVVAMFLLKPVESQLNVDEEREESQCFTVLNTVAIVLALYLLAYDLSGIEIKFFSKLIAGGLCIILVAPVALPVYLHVKVARRKKQATLNEPLLKNGKEEGTNEATICNDAEKVSPAEGRQGGVNVYTGKKKIGDDFTVLEAVRMVDFWLLFFCFLCGVGTGMAVINNMGQIGQSMGYSSVSMFVSLISIWGFFGRLGSGALSEALIRWKAVPRPVLLAVSQLVMVLGYVLLAVGAAGSLYVGSIVVGICYGVRLAVSVPVASEMFGLRAFGLMYNLLILNLPLGSFLFSSLLAGFLYDYEAAKDGSSTCLGTHCYRLVFLVMAGVSGMGFFLDLILTLRTRPLYQQIYRSKHCKS